jgi:hypothetical protein
MSLVEFTSHGRSLPATFLLYRILAAIFGKAIYVQATIGEIGRLVRTIPDEGERLRTLKDRGFNRGAKLFGTIGLAYALLVLLAIAVR